MNKFCKFVVFPVVSERYIKYFRYTNTIADRNIFSGLDFIGWLPVFKVVL